ncbi:MAG TPA: LL-diaminopimelate aminotransferase [Candidatus Amulumruptor caecigallinarius]|uniref:LL-diaminopimelate aminotransferase n=1 Tax=Candidatus Amulumruptor caecigallinarius TaxID=2109911 RepID=A0A921E9T1_9BACT|nr:LL-diaminopimelate aminotransferase [Candidatus Amulumruptor caecigallinarius]
MFKINDNFTKLQASYLFSQVAAKISAFMADNPGVEVIRMGIGDVTRPVCAAAIEAMHKAVDDEASAATFHGYGPEQGYAFLRDKIAMYDYNRRGIEVSADEIFISDGAKSDTGNIGDILSAAAKVAVTDPVYPVYVDTNVMAGRAGDLLADGRWSNIIYLPCTAANDFVPSLPTERPDVIYLCYPNNPTGTVLTREQLKAWVDYARANGCLILFDSAYEAYVTQPDVPRSIYEIEGAKKVAIEFRSYSKTAGFTGLRLGYTVVPKPLYGVGSDGSKVSLHSLWLRRQSTKFNGASYVIQRGAEALYSEEGSRQVKETVDYYMRNSRLLLEGVRGAGLQAFGGENSPYVWIKTPDGMDSWQFFDRMLSDLHIAGTPGVGFGPSGEGYFRLTAFNTYENTLKAVQRIKDWQL